MENKKVFDYPQDWTKKAIDKNGYYKLNDLRSMYNGNNRTEIGKQPTDPPIYNKDGFVVSKDGVSCFDGPHTKKINNAEVIVTRVYPNVPFSEVTSSIGIKLIDMYRRKLEEE